MDSEKQSWYTVDDETTVGFFDVLFSRPGLQMFNGGITFMASPDNGGCPPCLDLVTVMLACLGTQPLHPKTVLGIKYLRILHVELDDNACRLLAQAIVTDNLNFIEDLEFSVDKYCGDYCLADLGRALHQANVFALKSLSIGGAKEGYGFWEGFFEAIPAKGLERVNTFTAGSSCGAKSAGGIFAALSKYPYLLEHVTSLCIRGLVFRFEDCLKVSDAIAERTFPKLETFIFEGR